LGLGFLRTLMNSDLLAQKQKPVLDVTFGSKFLIG
jgi:hypothetical protein